MEILRKSGSIRHSGLARRWAHQEFIAFVGDGLRMTRQVPWFHSCLARTTATRYGVFWIDAVQVTLAGTVVAQSSGPLSSGNSCALVAPAARNRRPPENRTSADTLQTRVELLYLTVLNHDAFARQQWFVHAFQQHV